MAGISWIKIETTLPRKPVVYHVAMTLGVDTLTVVGALISLLCWADGVTSDGVIGKGGDTIIDSVCGLKGLSAALIEAGWLTKSDDGVVTFCEWDAHNGENAKKRALNARANVALRSRKRVARDESVMENNDARDENLSRNHHKSDENVMENNELDKIRIDKNIKALNAGACACEDVGGLVVLCRVYPKRTFATATVKAAYEACLADGITAEELITCLEMAKLSKAWHEEGGRYIPKLVAWLNERRFESDLGVIRQDAARKRSERQAQADEDEMNELVYGFEEDKL